MSVDQLLVAKAQGGNNDYLYRIPSVREWTNLVHLASV